MANISSWYADLPPWLNCSTGVGEDYYYGPNHTVNPHPSGFCLSPGQRIGLSLTAESGLVSVLAILVLFSLISRNAFRNWKFKEGKSLVQSPMDIYMLSLFFADVLQALGSVFDMKWAHDGAVYRGTYCTTQGVVQQLGECGVAISTLIIATHTFVTLFWKIGTQNRIVALALVGLEWLFIVLFVAISAGIHHSKNDLYDTPTPFWCWVAPTFQLHEGLAGEYIWLWLALVASVFSYTCLFFWSKGMLSVDSSRWWSFSVHRPSDPSKRDASGNRLALSMLAYPFVYSFIVLPLSIVRWITFGGRSVPSAATFFVVIIFSLSGFFNVLLLHFTRPGLLLFGSEVVRAGRGRAPSPSPSRQPERSGPDSSRPFGGLNDDNGWDLEMSHTPRSHLSIATTGKQAGRLGGDE